MTVKLEKAPYGCVQSAKLWYDELTSTLKKNGFIIANETDACVLNKINAYGNQCTIIVYVDDLLVLCKDEETLVGVKDMLVKAYKDVKKEIGNDLSYLVMRINMREGDIVISMNEYVLDVLAYYPDVRTSISPATADIYETKEAEMLTEYKKKEFLSTMMKPLYLAR